MSAHIFLVLAVGTLGSFLIEWFWYSPLFFGKGHLKLRPAQTPLRHPPLVRMILLLLSLLLQNIALYLLATESALNFYVIAAIVWLGYSFTHITEYYLDSHTPFKESLHFLGLKAVMVLYIATTFQVLN